MLTRGRQSGGGMLGTGGGVIDVWYVERGIVRRYTRCRLMPNEQSTTMGDRAPVLSFVGAVSVLRSGPITA